MARSGKWGLRQEKCVSRWLHRVDERRGGSENTKGIYLLVLQNFVKFTGKSPTALVRQAKKDLEAAHDEIDAFMEDLRKRYTSGSVRLSVAALRSFYKHNGVMFPSLVSPEGKPKLAAKPLTIEEVYRVLDLCDVREKALCSILAFCGIRGGSVERLSYADCKEDFEAGTIPCKLNAYDEKKNVNYVTFLNARAVEAVKNHLAVRRMGSKKIPAENIVDSSPLIGAYFNGQVVPLSHREITRRVKRLFRLAGIQGRVTTHSFRKFFHVRLVSAGVPESWCNLLAGRIAEAGAGSAYNLPEVEELRKKYAEGSRAFEPVNLPLLQMVEALQKNGTNKSVEIEELRHRTEEQEKLIQQLSLKLDAITEIWKNTTIYDRDDKMRYKLGKAMSDDAKSSWESEETQKGKPKRKAAK